MGADGRSVRFTEDEVRSRGHRSRDSGLGSSTEQAHVGGKSDRIFTAKDIEDQRFNIRALQEALESSNGDVTRYKNKAQSLDTELSTARRTIREKETLLRECITENQTLRKENDNLRLDNDSLRDENYDLRQQLTDPSLYDGEYMMSGGSGESSDGVKRSKSKRRSKPDMKDQMKVRINRGNPEVEATSSKPRKDSDKERRPRRSESRTRPPYIEEAPTIGKDRSRPPVTRHPGNYTTEPSVSSRTSMQANASVMTPRTTHGVTYNQSTTTGDYVPYALPPEKHSSERGRRHH